MFLRERKLNISLVFISQFYFKVPKTICNICINYMQLNATHHFIKKIPNKKELQQIASNHSSDIDLNDFIKICIDYTKEPYSFLVNDLTFLSDNPLRFKKNY